MLRKYLSLLSVTIIFGIYPINFALSGNFTKLENAAEDYSHWIVARISFTEEEIRYATDNIFNIEEVDEDREKIEKYSDRDNFMRLYNKILEPAFIEVNNPLIKFFFDSCKNIFIEAEEQFDFLKKSSVHILFERTLKKIEEEQVYFKREDTDKFEDKS